MCMGFGSGKYKKRKNPPVRIRRVSPCGDKLEAA